MPQLWLLVLCGVVCGWVEDRGFCFMGAVWDWVGGNAATVGGWVLTLVVAVAGWVINGLRVRKQDAESMEAKQKELDNSKEREHTLKAQLEEQRKAAEALQGQLDQLEEANRLFEQANPTDSDPWGPAVKVRGKQYRVTNEGPRDVVVEKVGPDDDQLPFSFDGHVPFDCGAGDGIDCFVPDTGMGTAAIKISWRFVGSTDLRTTRRPV